MARTLSFNEKLKIMLFAGHFDGSERQDVATKEPVCLSQRQQMGQSEMGKQ